MSAAYRILGIHRLLLQGERIQGKYLLGIYLAENVPNLRNTIVM